MRTLCVMLQRERINLYSSPGDVSPLSSPLQRTIHPPFPHPFRGRFILPFLTPSEDDSSPFPSFNNSSLFTQPVLSLSNCYIIFCFLFLHFFYLCLYFSTFLRSFSIFFHLFLSFSVFFYPFLLIIFSVLVLFSSWISFILILELPIYFTHPEPPFFNIFYLPPLPHICLFLTCLMTLLAKPSIPAVRVGLPVPPSRGSFRDLQGNL